jgi:protease-4
MLKRLFLGGLRRQIGRIEVAGAIDGKTRERVLKALKEVEENQIPAVVLRIDSPGGTVADSQEIYNALLRLREKKGTRIVASFGNIAASGGVYIAMGAEKIVANPGTITGSIGVIIRGNNIERLLDKVGISFKVIKSGPYKDILSFDRELTPEERNILQELIDITYGQFVQTVAAARKLSLNVVKTFADGRIFSGEQALHLGVVAWAQRKMPAFGRQSWRVCRRMRSSTTCSRGAEVGLGFCRQQKPWPVCSLKRAPRACPCGFTQVLEAVREQLFREV